MPIQTHTFAWSVVEALRDAGVGVTLLSVEPVSSYPGNPRIRMRGGRFTEKGVVGRSLPFTNLTVIKHITRLAVASTVGAWTVWRWRPEAILVHGVHSPFLLAGLLYRRLLGVPVVTILTDPPGVILPSDGTLVRVLKRFDRGVVRGLLRGHDGVIALTDELSAAFAPGKPALSLEGIVDSLPCRSPAETRPEGPAIAVYAGGLSSAYGVDRLVEAVLGLPPLKVRLQLLGRGELEGHIWGVASTDARINPPRFVDHAEVLRMYAQADVLVQPRPIDQDFVRFSFPSKLMEYLASGTPVVTTRLPGIPRDYDDHVEWADPDDAEGLRDAIARVLALGAQERQARGARAREFIWRTRGRASQGRRMRAFLEGLARKS